jgi:hypothetical protein
VGVQDAIDIVNRLRLEAMAYGDGPASDALAYALQLIDQRLREERDRLVQELGEPCDARR